MESEGVWGGGGGCSGPRDSIFEHNSLGEGKSVRENRFFSYLLRLVHTQPIMTIILATTFWVI